ncbi:IPT/TIG domain-containing protein [Bacillus sp. N9]
MNIQSVSITEDGNGNEILDIRGEGFVSEAAVYINDNVQKTTFINSTQIKSELSPSGKISGRV